MHSQVQHHFTISKENNTGIKTLSTTITFPPPCSVLCSRRTNKWVGVAQFANIYMPSVQSWLRGFTKHQDLFLWPLHELRGGGRVWVYIMQTPVMETYLILSALDPHIRPVRRTRQIQVPVSFHRFIANGLVGKPWHHSCMDNTAGRTLRDQAWKPRETAT